MNILSKSGKETFELGENIGKKLSGGMVVALEGDLGGGKTTFTKGLAKGLGIKEDIVSPSFTLERIYQLSAISYQLSGEIKDKNQVAESGKRASRLYHFDFYRIDNPKDMVSFELTEALSDPGGIVVVEWAEKIEAGLPEEKLVVKFHYEGENERLLELIAVGDEYQSLIKNENLKNKDDN